MARPCFQWLPFGSLCGIKQRDLERLVGNVRLNSVMSVISQMTSGNKKKLKDESKKLNLLLCKYVSDPK